MTTLHAASAKWTLPVGNELQDVGDTPRLLQYASVYVSFRFIEAPQNNDLKDLMDNMFDTWLDATEKTDGRKVLWRATEAANKRKEILGELMNRTRSHYVSDTDIATFLDVLNYHEAAEVVRENYPAGATGRSGDLGEILCAEMIEEWCSFNVPIRKLRYKDHRDQAMRGEDVIGIRHDDQGRLCLLKAEAKSAQSLSTATVNEARTGLEASSGRPTSHAMAYVARRLIDQGGDYEALGKEILQESVRRAVPKTRVTHCLFTITGNAAVEMIDDDFAGADGGRDQYIVHIRIPPHGEFVGEVYEGVINLALG